MSLDVLMKAVGIVVMAWSLLAMWFILQRLLVLLWILFHGQDHIEEWFAYRDQGGDLPYMEWQVSRGYIPPRD